MAGYRPKSLDDINNSYDSEISVSREIKRETTRLSQHAPSVDDVFGNEKKIPSVPEVKTAEAPAPVEDFSDAVEDFIKQISAKHSSVEKSKASKNKGEPIIYSTKKKPEETFSFEEPVSFKAPAVQKTAEPVQIPDPAATRSEDDFSDLISDYVKIMNDMDEDPSEKKSFLSRKKNKKKFSQKQISEAFEETKDEDDFFGLSEMQEDVSVQKDSFDMLERAGEDKKEEASADSFFDALDISAEAYSEKVSTKEADEVFHGSFEELLSDDFDEEDNSFEKTEERSNPKRKNKKARKEKKANQKKEKQTKEAELKEKQVDFAPLEDENDFEAENNTEAVREKKAPKDKKSASSIGRIAARVVLSLVLAASFVITLLVGSLGMVFHVNEGISAPGSLYFFTASRDFEGTEIKMGDLVICDEKNMADDGEVVVYVDRQNRTFSFGTKEGSITGTDGENYYVINDMSVMRKNVLGVVGKSIPNMGKVVTTVYSNYIIVLLGLLVLCIVLFLVVTIGLRNKEKAEAVEEKNQKKKTAKK